MLCEGGVQRTFFPINRVAHTVNNLHHVTAALSNIGAALRLFVHLLSILLHLQLNMLMGQRAIVLFLNHGLCLCTHFATPFRYYFQKAAFSSQLSLSNHTNNLPDNKALTSFSRAKCPTRTGGPREYVTHTSSGSRIS